MKYSYSGGVLFCYAAIFLLSLNGLFANGIALDFVSITAIRSLIAIVALSIFFVVYRRQTRLYSKRECVLVYCVGLLMGLHWLTFFGAMQKAGVAVGMLALFTYPVLTVFLEPVFNRKTVRTQDVLAAMLVLLGIIVMTLQPLEGSRNGLVVGVMWGLVSALFFTLRNLLQKYHLQTVKSEALMLHQLIVIALMCCWFVDYSALPLLDVKNWFLLVLLGVFTTALAHTLLVESLKRLAAKKVAMLSCLQPVLGAIFAWLLLDEELTVAIVVGGSIIISVAIYESMQKNS